MQITKNNVDITIPLIEKIVSEILTSSSSEFHELLEYVNYILQVMVDQEGLTLLATAAKLQSNIYGDAVLLTCTALQLQKTIIKNQLEVTYILEEEVKTNQTNNSQDCSSCSSCTQNTTNCACQGVSEETKGEDS